MSVREMVIAVLDADEGNYVTVGYDGEIDYSGNNVNSVMGALTACDELELHAYDVTGRHLGWAMIVNDPEPELCDCSGIFTDWEMGILDGNTEREWGSL